MTVSRERFPEIDFLRGLSVIAMVLFHLFWDLVYFDLVPWDLFGVDPLVIAQTIGASFQLSLVSPFHHCEANRWNQHGRLGKRYSEGLKLMAWATVVSLVVYFTADAHLFRHPARSAAIILSPLFLQTLRGWWYCHYCCHQVAGCPASAQLVAAAFGDR